MKAWSAPGVFPMLAHQGGWDEMLLVVGPLLLIGLALYVANKRVAAQLAPGQGTGQPETAGQPVEGSGNGGEPILPDRPAGDPAGPAER